MTDQCSALDSGESPGINSECHPHITVCCTRMSVFLATTTNRYLLSWSGGSLIWALKTQLNFSVTRRRCLYYNWWDMRILSACLPYCLSACLALHIRSLMLINGVCVVCSDISHLTRGKSKMCLTKWEFPPHVLSLRHTYISIVIIIDNNL